MRVSCDYGKHQATLLSPSTVRFLEVLHFNLELAKIEMTEEG
jgi:hypothetical protein